MSNLETHQQLDDTFNRRDWDVLDRHVREDLSYTDTPRGLTLKSRDEFKDWTREWIAAFPDARTVNPHYLDGRTFTVCRFQAQGTNEGPFGSFEPTGRRVDVAMCEIFHFDSDGMVEAGEIYYDRMAFLTQLGHLEVSS